MNAKLAKQIRKLARDFNPDPKTDYETDPRDHKPQITREHKNRNPTIKVNKNCQRGIYRQLQNEFINAK